MQQKKSKQVWNYVMVTQIHNFFILGWRVHIRITCNDSKALYSEMNLDEIWFFFWTRSATESILFVYIFTFSCIWQTLIQSSLGMLGNCFIISYASCYILMASSSCETPRSIFTSRYHPISVLHRCLHVQKHEVRLSDPHMRGYCSGECGNGCSPTLHELHTESSALVAVEVF